MIVIGYALLLMSIEFFIGYGLWLTFINGYGWLSLVMYSYWWYVLLLNVIHGYG